MSLAWRLVRALFLPALLGVLAFLALFEPITFWLRGNQIFDEEAIQEWIREANVYKTMPELIREYGQLIDQARKLGSDEPESSRWVMQARLTRKRQELLEHLRALCNPPTKMYPGQLPLFPIIYRIEIQFDPAFAQESLVWDSELPRQRTQYRQLEVDLESSPGRRLASVQVQYHLHAFTQRQSQEWENRRRNLWLFGLGSLLALGGIVWFWLAQRRKRDRERRELLAELRRQEAERRREEAEKINLELKSQTFANIGIMAGSYAHNIKNLLVRPNDLLRRCLDESSSPGEQSGMLREVQHTLGTVTERLQQILQTVRRDPTKAEKTRLDLNRLAEDLSRTWTDLAREKWKLTIEVTTAPEPLWLEGDHSHLQQALENLLFNARDATFEMRNQLRDRARSRNQGTAEDRQALIAAAAWKGNVTIVTRREQGQAIFEIKDNGIGMTPEVRARCLETHFTTKRGNALFAGLSAGMGLGLSFVNAILEHHGAKLEVESEPGQGALFRVRFPGG